MIEGEFQIQLDAARARGRNDRQSEIDDLKGDIALQRKAIEQWKDEYNSLESRNQRLIKAVEGIYPLLQKVVFARSILEIDQLSLMDATVVLQDAMEDEKHAGLKGEK